MSETRLTRRTVAPLVLVIAAIAAPGCIHVGIGGDDAPRPRDVIHTLDRAEVTRAPVTKGSEPTAVVAVRTFRSRDRFDRHVVARVDAGSVRSLDYDLWADEPAQAVSEAFREGLVESGLCAAAPDAADGVVVSAVVDGVIQEFAWDEAAGAARFRARITMSRGSSGVVVWSGVVEGTEPIPSKTTAGLGPAMGRAVGKAIDAAVAAWRSSPTVQLALSERRN